MLRTTKIKDYNILIKKEKLILDLILLILLIKITGKKTCILGKVNFVRKKRFLQNQLSFNDLNQLYLA